MEYVDRFLKDIITYYYNIEFELCSITRFPLFHNNVSIIIFRKRFFYIVLQYS
jgi:hypothetical protein